MIVDNQEFKVNGLTYAIRSAITSDAKDLSELGVQVDGETEGLDRENCIVGFSRCEGIYLKRFSHKVEFGVCVLKDFWGCGIGKNLLKQSIAWADSNGIKKINLNVLEANNIAIELYKRLDFEIEGILKNDKILSNGQFYNTIVMGRFNE